MKNNVWIKLKKKNKKNQTMYMYHEKLKRFGAVSKSNCAVLTSAYDED
jgi:hypothetical protein